MPPQRSSTLTEAELRIMRVLWRQREASVNDIVGALAEVTTLAYNSVLTTVRILEDKGFVTHVQRGRAFIYSPRVDEREAMESEVRRMLGRFFGHSRERLLLSLLKDEDVTAAELTRIRRAIDEAESQARVEDDRNAGAGRSA